MDVLVTHTRFLDQFLGGRRAGGHSPGGDPGVGFRHSAVSAVWWPRGKRVGATLSANRCAVGIDLRQDWLGALRRVGFDDAQPTVWVVEQLLVGYLPPSGQNRLLNSVGMLFGGAR